MGFFYLEKQKEEKTRLKEEDRKAGKK